MISLLKEAHEVLLRHLPTKERIDLRGWQSAYTVFNGIPAERLWRPMGELHLVLQRSYPGQPGSASLHHHVGPVAVQILTGTCEMGVGYGSVIDPAALAARMILPAGSVYEMPNGPGWHWVRPLEQPSLSLMVTGRLWNEEVDPLLDLVQCPPLTAQQHMSIFSEIAEVFAFGNPFLITV